MPCKILEICVNWFLTSYLNQISIGDPSSFAQMPADFNTFLRIDADSRVTCFTGKIEMGQGVITSLARY